jgi:Zn-dependent peptidase ImmA (M78 family)
MSIDIQLQKEVSHLRSLWGLGSADPVQVPSLVLKLNLQIVFRQLNVQFSGMSVKTDNHAFVLINSNHPIGRQNFTICHELYHIYVQKEPRLHSCSIEGFDKKDKEEYAANIFASLFLMPSEGVLGLIPENELKKNKVLLPTILKIEQYFQCSRSATLYRLQSLGLIDLKAYDVYRLNIAKDALKYGYDTALYKPGRHNTLLGDYGPLAKQLFDSGKISESHYVSLLRDIGIDIDAVNNDD